MSFGAFGQAATTQPSTNAFGTSTGQPSGFAAFSANPSPFASVGTAPSGGPYGASNNAQATQPATGGGLFGTTQPAQTSTGGLFGNNQPQQQQQQQQQPAQGGLFGGGPTTTGASNMFGGGVTQNMNQPGTGLFGPTAPSQPIGGGLFGASNATATQPSTGLFGASSTQPTSNPGSTGLFSATGATGGGLFGNTTTQPTAAGMGGLFGNPTTQPSTTGAGGLFGNTASSNTGMTGGGLFGTTNTAANTSGAAGTSIFGQPQQQQQQPQQMTSLFGQPLTNQQPTTSIFGASTAQPQAGGMGLFGAPKSGGLGGFGLGSTATVIAPSTSLGTSMLGQSFLGPNHQTPNVSDQITAVVSAWDPSSPACRFQYYFYNVVSPGEISRYGRPHNATNEALWQKALRENPDPSRLVPALALGFDDLRKRADVQTSAAKMQQQQLATLSARLDAISQKHATSTSLRAQQAAVQHSLIAQRLTSLIQVLHRLLPSLRSTSIRPEEEALRTMLEQIEDELRRPGGGMGRMKGKLNELWNAVMALKAVRERAKQVGSGVDGPVEWAVVDEDGLSEITKVLHDQQQGLTHLTKIVTEDAKDINIISEGGSTSSSVKRPATNLNTLSGKLSRSLLG